MSFTVPRKYQLTYGTPFRLHLTVLPETPEQLTRKQIAARIADPHTGETLHMRTQHAAQSDKLMHMGMWRLWNFANENRAWKHVRYIEEFSPKNTPSEYVMLEQMVWGVAEHPTLWAPIVPQIVRARRFMPNLPDDAYQALIGMNDRTNKRNAWVLYVRCHNKEYLTPLRRFPTSDQARTMRDQINDALEFVRVYPDDIQAEIDAYNKAK